jgi:hypothetical protein
MNRILNSVTKLENQMKDRLEKNITTQEEVDNLHKSLDMDISEYVKFQELKSLFCANGLLSLEEAQTIYSYLGNSVEHFNSQNVIVKSVLTKLFAEMLQKT